VHAISLTSPADAFRAAAVSRIFQAAADSDTVWSRFLPRDMPRFAKKELTHTPPPSTKKGLFRCLSDEPVLLPRKYMVRAYHDWCLRTYGSYYYLPPQFNSVRGLC
jgi:hypothetical protein